MEKKKYIFMAKLLRTMWLLVLLVYFIFVVVYPSLHLLDWLAEDPSLFTAWTIVIGHLIFILITIYAAQKTAKDI